MNWSCGKCASAVISALIAVALDGMSAAAENIVENGDFRHGSQGWSVPKTGWKVVSGEGMDGDGALVWENDDPSYYAFPAYHFKGRPGAVYRFRGLIREDSLKGNSTMIGFEWSSSEGKWMGGAYGRAVFDNDVSVKDGWVKYEVTTSPMPADIGRIAVFAAVRKGAVGRVRFGGFEVYEEVLDPLVFFVSSVLRDEAARGPVGFFAGLHVDLANNTLSDYVAEVDYRDANGVRQTRKADEFAVERAVFRMEAEDLALGRQDILFRLRLKSGQTVATKALPFTRHKEMPRRRIAFDSARRLIVDGKPFFPLGMYGCPEDEEGIKKYLEAPFNFTTLYGLAGRKRLDPYAAHGIYVATDVRFLIDGYDATFKGVAAKTREQSRAAIKAKVEEIGNHPALLLWYLTDEVSYCHIPNVAAANAYFHELDPEHPTYSVQDNPGDCQWYLPCCDVMATDCYPIGNGRPISKVGEWVKLADEKMGGFRPAWKVPQAFDWSWFFKGKDLERPDLRFPEREELANMTWQAIAAGANGICYYDFAWMQKSFRDCAAGFDAAWASVKSVANDLKRMEPTILSDPSELKPTDPLPAETYFRAWKDGAGERVLFVNATRMPLETVLTFPESYARMETLLGEMPELSGNKVKVSLPSLGVTLFSLSKSRGVSVDPIPTSGSVKMDVAYAPELGKAGLGDLYLPQSMTATTSVVLAIHGGGWSGGDRASWSGVADFFRTKLNCAVFNIEYRLASQETPWPACGDDCVRAAKWLLSSSFTEVSGLNPKKIWICGGSAGGHLALWTLVNLSPESVEGVVSISAIGDPLLDAGTHEDRYRRLFGRRAAKDDFVSLDPRGSIKRGMAPLLCTHATSDQVVQILSHRAFADAYIRAGNICSFVEYPCDVRPNLTGHCIWLPESRPHRLIPEIEAEIIRFFEENRGK